MMMWENTGATMYECAVFVRKKHKDQLDDEGIDYVNAHLWPVARILHHVGCDKEICMAGLLHDTLEDTNTTYEELVESFGKRVADLVLEVTHEGQADEYGYYFPRLKSKEAIMIKLADRLSNISRMDSWDEKRQSQYLRKTKFWKDGSDLK